MRADDKIGGRGLQIKSVESSHQSRDEDGDIAHIFNVNSQ